jgi:uncharacterized membrane protein YgcG
MYVCMYVCVYVYIYIYTLPFYTLTHIYMCVCKSGPGSTCVWAAGCGLEGGGSDSGGGGGG